MSDLAERVDKLMDAADHLVWATEIEQTKKAMAALTGEQNGVAAALAACAREACAESQRLGTGPVGVAYAIRALERAVGEKA